MLCHAFAEGLVDSGLNAGPSGVHRALSRRRCAESRLASTSNDRIGPGTRRPGPPALEDFLRGRARPSQARGTSAASGFPHLRLTKVVLVSGLPSRSSRREARHLCVRHLDGRAGSGTLRRVVGRPQVGRHRLLAFHSLPVRVVAVFPVRGSLCLERDPPHIP
jgi:hypothetical protein